MPESIWDRVVARRVPEPTAPAPTAVQYDPPSELHRDALDVLHVLGLLTEDWPVNDFRTALVLAIASAPSLEQLKLLQVYPGLVYCIRTLTDEGPGYLKILAEQAEV